MCPERERTVEDREEDKQMEMQGERRGEEGMNKIGVSQ